MINLESKQEWQANPVTMEMMKLIEVEKQRLIKGLADGNYLNLQSMEGSFGETARCVGEIAGITSVENLLSKEE